MTDNNKVICPNCVNEFRAVPVNVQAKVAELEKVLRYIRSVAVDGETPAALACFDIGEAAIAALAAGKDKP